MKTNNENELYVYWAGWSSNALPDIYYSGNLLSFSVLNQYDPPYTFSHDSFLSPSSSNYTLWKSWDNKYGTSILSFGGGGDTRIAKILYEGNDYQLEELAKAIAHKVISNNMDGVDLDVEFWWDYNQTQKARFSVRLAEMVKKLRTRFNDAGRPKATISVAVARNANEFMHNFFNDGVAMEALDHIMVMTYVDIDTDFYRNQAKVDALIDGFKMANAPLAKVFFGVSPMPNQYQPTVIESVENITRFAEHVKSRGMRGAFFWAVGSEGQHQTIDSSVYIDALAKVFDIKSNFVPPNTGLSSHKIDAANFAKYSNTYEKDNRWPGVTAYLSNWTHYSQGYEPNLDELAKYDTVLLSFFGLCGTEIGDPSVTGGVNALKTNCAKYGLDKFELSSTDAYADLEKQFPGMGMSWQPDLTWLSPNPNGLIGVMKKLHEERGTRIGISVFGWSLSNIVSDAVKPENRQTFLNSLINFVKAYPFIGQLDIDWEYPGIQGAPNNVFDPVNDARNYKEFIQELRTALDNIGRQDMRIGIASGAPLDKIDAAKLNDLVAAGVDDIHLMTYDFFGQWDSTTNHQTNLYSADDSKWSADKSIQYMINELGIPSRNIRLGYANYSRNAIIDGDLQPSPLKADFIPVADTAGTFEAGVTTANDFFANFVSVNQNAPMTGKSGYQLYTDKAANADYVYNKENGLFVSIDTPRTVYAKAKYVKKHNLGGIFTWMADHDEGLMLNAAREGLGYQAVRKVFDMNSTIYSCGVNVKSQRECCDLTHLRSIESSGADVIVQDRQEPFTNGKTYMLSATLSGVGKKQISQAGWTITSVSGASKSDFIVDNKDGKVGALAASFTARMNSAPAADVVLTFAFDAILKNGTTLSETMTYTLEANGVAVPEITQISHRAIYEYAAITTGKTLGFTVNASDSQNGHLSYRWTVTPASVSMMPGTETSSTLVIDTRSLTNKPAYDITAQVVVTNSLGNSQTAAATTKVIGDASANNVPVAAFSILTANPEAGDIIEMQSTSQDEFVEDLTYQWSVTRGGHSVAVDQSKGQSASFSADLSGEYLIELMVKDAFGSTSATSQVVYVAESTDSGNGGCSQTDPEAANHPAWDSSMDYNTSNVVSHAGLVYEAKWWTQGNEPSPTAPEWQLLSQIELGWNPQLVFNGGDQTDFNGRRWQAKWWTQGEQPGTSDVWVDIGAAKCSN